MKLINNVSKQIRSKFSNPFIRNLSWLGIAEIVYRVVRLGLVVIISKHLSEYDYGLGAVVLMVKDFAVSFSNVGIGAKIIQAEEEDLPRLRESAYWLNWLVFSGLFVIQCLAAFPIAWIRNTPELILPICVSGLAYLIWPITGIQKTLLQRENRFKIVALTDSVQFSVASIFTAILAFGGLGVWAFALPSVMIAPLEVIIYRYFQPWRPSYQLTFGNLFKIGDFAKSILAIGITNTLQRNAITKSWVEIWDFGKNILAIGLLNTLRNNLDYLIIYTLVGVKDLGLYFFGFNAGLGISLSLINAIKSATLPHLCAARSDRDSFPKAYLHTIKIITLVIIPFVCLQTSLAPYYVPTIFDQKWIPAIPIVMLICISAIPRPFADAASQLLVTIGRPDLDLRWNALFTVLFAIALLIGSTGKIIGVATAVVIAHFLFLPPFTLWATNFVFPELGKGFFSRLGKLFK